MLATSLITLRETLEASLVVAIMLTFLTRTNNERFKKYVWFGVVAGVITSIVAAVLLQLFAGELQGKAAHIYQGSMLLVAAGLLVWMIFWMAKQGKHMKRHIEDSMTLHITNEYALGIFLVSFLGTTREGVETVIFLQATMLNAALVLNVVAAAVGMTGAIALAYAISRGFTLISLRRMFQVTSVLLLIFCVTVIGQGIHELVEAFA